MSVAQHRGGPFWSVRKVAVTASLAVFLTLAGSGVSYAYWTATANVTATVSTGQVTVDLSTKDLDAVVFGNDLTPETGSFTVKNTSSADGVVVVSLGATDDIVSNFVVRIWPTSTVSTCGTDTVPIAASTGTWQSASVTGQLAANASATYCVRTSVSDRAAVASTAGAFSFAPAITATLSVHNWSGTATEAASIRTSQIFPAVSTVVGDKYVQGAQCVLATDGTDPGTTPPACAATITPTNAVQVQGPVTSGTYQLVTTAGMCLEVDVDSVTEKTCSGDGAQLFTVEPAAVLPVIPVVAP